MSVALGRLERVTCARSLPRGKALTSTLVEMGRDMSDVLRRLVGDQWRPAVGFEAPEELIEGVLTRSHLSDGTQSVVAQTYYGLGELGGHLWEQDVRSLLRVSALDHPALPSVRDGGYDATLDIGYVLTGTAALTLASDGAIEFLRANPVDALKQFALLADALAVMHSQGLIHRNLVPASVNVEPPTEHVGIAASLARFEMSALLSSLARGGAGPEIADQLRDATIAEPDQVLAHLPPERLDSLFEGGLSTHAETDRSDVYGLGVLAWSWFVGDLAPILESADGERRDRLRLVQREMRAEVTRAEQRAGLPGALADLLRSLLETSPVARPTAAQVVTAIRRSYSTIVSSWTEPSTDRPFLVLFMPEEFSKTVYRWGWLANDPRTDVGVTELSDWLAVELQGADLHWSPNGAAEFVDDPAYDKLVRAKAVLVGTSAAWFCETYRPPKPFGGFDEAWPQALVVKYVVRREHLRGRLDGQRFRRDAPPIEARSWKVDRAELDSDRSTRPSWTALLDSVRDEGERPAWQDQFSDARRAAVPVRDPSRGGRGRTRHRRSHHGAEDR